MNTENQDSLEKVVFFLNVVNSFISGYWNQIPTLTEIPVPRANLKQFFLLLIDYISYIVFKLNKKKAKKSRIKSACL